MNQKTARLHSKSGITAVRISEDFEDFFPRNTMRMKQQRLIVGYQPGVGGAAAAQPVYMNMNDMALLKQKKQLE